MPPHLLNLLTHQLPGIEPVHSLHQQFDMEQISRNGAHGVTRPTENQEACFLAGVLDNGSASLLTTAHERH